MPFSRQFSHTIALFPYLRLKQVGHLLIRWHPIQDFAAQNFNVLFADFEKSHVHGIIRKVVQNRSNVSLSLGRPLLCMHLVLMIVGLAKFQHSAGTQKAGDWERMQVSLFATAGSWSSRVRTPVKEPEGGGRTRVR